MVNITEPVHDFSQYFVLEALCEAPPPPIWWNAKIVCDDGRVIYYALPVHNPWETDISAEQFLHRFQTAHTWREAFLAWHDSIDDLADHGGSANIYFAHALKLAPVLEVPGNKPSPLRFDEIVAYFKCFLWTVVFPGALLVGAMLLLRWLL